MNEVLALTYDAQFVGLSFVISVFGSYIGLMACQKIVGRNGRVDWYNAISGGMAIGGVAVWAMHFIGMLGLTFNLASGYAMVETLVSLLAAIASTAMALSFVAKAPKSTARVVGAGIALGLGVCVMHYLGMAGMRFNGSFVWDPVLVAASVGIAVVAATAALWLAFRTTNFLGRLVSALIMGVAVCAMHYTGMAAADIVCAPGVNRSVLPQSFGVVAAFNLPLVVVITTIALASLIFLDQVRQMGRDD